MDRRVTPPINLRYRVAHWVSLGMAGLVGITGLVLLQSPEKRLGSKVTEPLPAVTTTSTPVVAAPLVVQTTVPPQEVQTGTAPGPVACAGGSSKKPFLVVGPVKLTGPDFYSLDRDHDGIACEG